MSSQGMRGGSMGNVMDMLRGGSMGGGGGYGAPWRQNAGLGDIDQRWNLQTGGADPNANMQAAAGATPGAPPWLQQQLGQFYNQPFATDPSIYGRWNWAGSQQPSNNWNAQPYQQAGQGNYGASMAGDQIGRAHV